MSKRNIGSRANGAKKGEIERKNGSGVDGKADEREILSLGAIHIYKLNVKNNRDIADIIYEPNGDTKSKSSSSKFDWCCCCRFASRQKERVVVKSRRNERLLEMKDPLLHKKGDDELAHNAHLYHYQQKKKQLLEEERRSNNSSGSEETVPLTGLSAVVNGDGDMDEEEEEYDEDDDQEVTINGQPVSTTVYECSGLASTEDMEIKNPLFGH